MTIGIIGAGALGSSVARALAHAEISATISSHRGPALLATLVDELGLNPFITAGTVEEAASSDIVVVAVRWVDTPTVLSGLPPWHGRIVLDATNPVEFLDPESPDAKDPTNPLAAYGIKAIDLGSKHSSEVLAELVPGARVVKASITSTRRRCPNRWLPGGNASCSWPATTPRQETTFAN